MKPTIRELNKHLRQKYFDPTNIRHYQGHAEDETHLTTTQIRIFAGWTEELLNDLNNLNLITMPF